MLGRRGTDPREEQEDWREREVLPWSKGLTGKGRRRLHTVDGGDDLLTEPGLCRPEKYCRGTLPRRTVVRCVARRRFVGRICRRLCYRQISRRTCTVLVYTTVWVPIPNRFLPSFFTPTTNKPTQNVAKALIAREMEIRLGIDRTSNRTRAIVEIFPRRAYFTTGKRTEG